MQSSRSARATAGTNANTRITDSMPASDGSNTPSMQTPLELMHCMNQVNDYLDNYICCSSSKKDHIAVEIAHVECESPCDLFRAQADASSPDYDMFPKLMATLQRSAKQHAELREEVKELRSMLTASHQLAEHSNGVDEEVAIQIEPDKISEDDAVLASEKYTTYELNPDIYSGLLVTFMHKRTNGLTRCCSLSWPMLLAPLCWLFQLWCAWVVNDHIQSNMVPSMWTPPSLGVWQLSHTGEKYSDSQMEEICGVFDEYKVSPPEPGANVTLPGGHGGFSDIFFYGKGFEWVWDAKKLGPDRKILDDSRWVIEEGLLSMHHGYAILFALLIFMWTCAIVVELRKVMQFGLMTIGVPTKTDEGNSIEMEVIDDEPQWCVKQMSLAAKCLGCCLMAMQAVVALVLGWVGVNFLMHTTSKVDLLLNSLGLAFILELDDIIFSAIIPKTQQHFVSNLEPIKYVSRVPQGYLKMHRFTFPPLAIALCLIVTFMSRSMQLDEFSTLFNLSSALCLFGGPSQPSVNQPHFAPVTGFCESLLSLTCAGPGTQLPNATDIKGDCVITDFEVPWPKNVSVASEVSIWPSDLFQKSRSSSPWAWKWSADPKVVEKFSLRSHHQPATLDILRRTCASMYRPGKVERRLKGSRPKGVREAQGGEGVGGDTEDDDSDGSAMHFSCRQDSGLGDLYFNNLEWTSRLPVLDLLGKNEELGQWLSRCH